MNEKLVFKDIHRGMPCHKYILRKIKDTMEAKIFSRYLIDSLTLMGTTDDEIENCLVFLNSSLNCTHFLSTFDFKKLGASASITGCNYVQSIRIDDSIPIFKSCVHFYKKYEMKCRACVLCPISSAYTNKNIKKEGVLLNHLLQNKKHLEIAIKKGLTSSSFKSIFDLADNFSIAEEPIIFPFYYTVFTLIQKQEYNDLLFPLTKDTDSVYEKFRDEIYYAIWELKLPDFFRTNDNALITLELLIEELICLPKISDDEFHMILNEIIWNKNFLNKKLDAISTPLSLPTVVQTFMQTKFIGMPLNETVNTLEENILDFYSPTSIAPNEIKESIVDKELKQVADNLGSAFVEITIDNLINNENDLENEQENISTTLTNNTVANKEETNESLNNDVYQYQFLEESNNTTRDLNIDDNDTDENIKSMEPEEQPEIQNVHTVDKEEKDTIIPHVNGEIIKTISLKKIDISEELIDEKIKISNDIVMYKEGVSYVHEKNSNELMVIPIVYKQELEHFAINLDTGNIRLLYMIKSYTLKDKRICIELIRDENGVSYFLLFLPCLQVYVYTTLRNTHVYKTLKPLLEYPSISKVCYYPFATLSILFMLGIYAKNVSSIYSLATMLFENQFLSMDIVLEKMGAVKITPGVTIKREGVVSSIPLTYMHSYFVVLKRNKYLVKRKGLILEYEKIDKFYNALSRSYYQKRYLKKNDLLFSIPTIGAFQFRLKFDVAAKKDGACYLFKFNQVPIEINLFIRDIIIKLEMTDRFRNCNIQLLSMGIDFFALFIINEEINYMESLINATVLHYLLDNKIRGVQLKISRIKDGIII